MLNSVVTTNCKLFKLGGRSVTGSGASGEQVDIVSTNGASVKINGIVPTAGSDTGTPDFPLQPPIGTAKIIDGSGDIDLVTGNINTPDVINCGSLVSSGGSSEVKVEESGVRSSTLTEQSLVMEVDLSTVVQGSEKIQLTEEGLQVLEYAGTTYNTHTRIGSDGIILDGRFNGSTTSGSLRVGGLSQAFFSQVTDTSLLVENGTEKSTIRKDEVVIEDGAVSTQLQKDGVNIIAPLPNLSWGPNAGSLYNYANNLTFFSETWHVNTSITIPAHTQLKANDSWLAGQGKELGYNRLARYSYFLLDGSTGFDKYLNGVDTGTSTRLDNIGWGGLRDATTNAGQFCSWDLSIHFVTNDAARGITNFPNQTGLADGQFYRDLVLTGSNISTSKGFTDDVSSLNYFYPLDASYEKMADGFDNNFTSVLNPDNSLTNFVNPDDVRWDLVFATTTGGTERGAFFLMFPPTWTNTASFDIGVNIVLKPSMPIA